MGQFPSSSVGGGSSAIYEDGDPVEERLNPGEDVTVPTGETWVAHVISRDTNAEIQKVNVTTADGGLHSRGQIVIKGGTTIENTSSNSGHVLISGWAV